MTEIEKTLEDTMSVAPAGEGERPQADAGQDASIEERLQRDPGNLQAQLDRGSDESMDASDPPAAAAPGGGEPVASSGYDEAAEQARQEDA